MLDVPNLVGVVADCLPHLLPDQGQRFLDVMRHATKRGGLLIDWRHKSKLGIDVNDPQWAYREITRWNRSAKITERWTPHQLRHGFVTNLLRAGMPIALVSRLANHSDITTTMRYAKLGGSDLREWRAMQQPQQSQNDVVDLKQWPRTG